MTPKECRHVKPYMRVSFGGKTYKVQVEPGEDGAKHFEREIRRLLTLPEEQEFDVIFHCKAPRHRCVVFGCDISVITTLLSLCDLFKLQQSLNLKVCCSQRWMHQIFKFVGTVGRISVTLSQLFLALNSGSRPRLSTCVLRAKVCHLVLNGSVLVFFGYSEPHLFTNLLILGRPGGALHRHFFVPLRPPLPRQPARQPVYLYLCMCVCVIVCSSLCWFFRLRDNTEFRDSNSGTFSSTIGF